MSSSTLLLLFHSYIRQSFSSLSSSSVIIFSASPLSLIPFFFSPFLFLFYLSVLYLIFFQFYLCLPPPPPPPQLIFPLSSLSFIIFIYLSLCQSYVSSLSGIYFRLPLSSSSCISFSLIPCPLLFFSLPLTLYLPLYLSVCLIFHFQLNFFFLSVFLVSSSFTYLSKSLPFLCTLSSHSLSLCIPPLANDSCSLPFRSSMFSP